MKVLDVWYAKLDIDTLLKNAPDAEAKRNRERIADEARAHVTDYVFPGLPRSLKEGGYCRPAPPRVPPAS